MYLNDAAQILVIILSVTLIVFLILGIVLLAKLVGISNRIKKIATAVEETVDNIHDVIKGVKAVVTPAAVAQAITGWIEKLTKSKSKKGGKDE
jgi:hypothetical protein